MPAQQPADVHLLVAGAITACNREAALSLYEAGASLVAEPGQVASGPEAVAAALDAFIALKPTLDIQTTQVVQAGAIALLRSTWTLRGTDADGQPLEMRGASADVVRRQADGNWRYVIDNPWAAS